MTNIAGALAREKQELEKHIEAARIVKERIKGLKDQIEVLNKKGEELAYHCTFLNGGIKVLTDIEKEIEDESL